MRRKTNGYVNHKRYNKDGSVTVTSGSRGHYTTRNMSQDELRQQEANTNATFVGLLKIIFSLLAIGIILIALFLFIILI